MPNIVRKKVTQCVLGGITFSEIQYYGFKPVFTGSGGKAVTERTVAGTQKAIALTSHHYRYQLILGLDADVWESIYDKNYEVPGTTFNVTVTEEGVNQTNGASVSRTITFNSVALEEINDGKLEEAAEHATVEIILFALNKPTKTAWT